MPAITSPSVVAVDSPFIVLLIGECCLYTVPVANKYECYECVSSLFYADAFSVFSACEVEMKVCKSLKRLKDRI